MAVDSVSFRVSYPEFSDSKFPTPVIDYWLGIAYQMLPASRWGAQLDLAVSLYTAHNVALESKAVLESANGIPGMASGPKTSKSVDKVSVSYDVALASEQGAGHWNLTIYGTRLYRLIKLFGAGPLQIGTSYSNSGAWSGPDVMPSPNG